MSKCITCSDILLPEEEGPLCWACDEDVRNPTVTAHLHAHEAGLNKDWLDAKQESRKRWFRRKGNWKGESFR